MTAPFTLSRRRQSGAALTLAPQALRWLRGRLQEDRADQIAQLLEQEAMVGSVQPAERDLALAAISRAREAVDDIDHAIGRIDAGTYGSCERCGAGIPFERLEALPQARVCVACHGRPAGLLW